MSPDESEDQSPRAGKPQPDPPDTTPPGPANADAPAGAWAWPLWQLAALTCLCLWAFGPRVLHAVSNVTRSSETIHALVAPIAMALIAWRRRRDLLARPPRGSAWGLALVLAGLAMYAAAIWPFSYGYARDIAVFPVLAGAIVIACGWRALRLWLPILLLLLLSIPVSTRLYLSLTSRPAAWTLSAVARTLAILPGVRTAIHGTDLIISGTRGSAALGLGGSRWGSEVLMALAVIGAFVTFSRIRPLGRIVWVAILAAPIVLLCNFIRQLSWAAIATWGGADVASSAPRYISTIIAAAAAHGLFALACSMKTGLSLFVEVEEDDQPASDAPAQPAPAAQAAAPAAAPATPCRTRRLPARLIVTAVVLVAAGFALLPGVKAIAAHYTKTPIPLRRPLEKFDVGRLPTFADWERTWHDPPLDELGTDQCIWVSFRKRLKTGTLGAVSLNVAYHSEAGDKIPHTPDVCSRQAGATVTRIGTATIDLPSRPDGHAQIHAGLWSLKWPKYNQVMIHLFVVEGQFVTSRREARLLVATPGNRRTYHASIIADAKYILSDTPDESIALCKQLLREAMPILLTEHFPSTDQIKRR